MGWVESVPWFCLATKTGADIANAMPLNVHLPPHPLEQLAMTKPPDEPDPPCPKPNARGGSAPLNATAAMAPPVLQPFHKPVTFTDVYLDDYLLGVQGNAKACLQHLRRLLYAIDEVFCPVDGDNSKHRNHVPSIKKFLKGDADLSTQKVVLGWIIDVLKQTLELPPHRIQRLREIFDYLRHRDRVGTSMWHKILGELRSMSIGIPGSRGLFSMLQEGLKFRDQNRIRITKAIWDQLLDFEYLTNDLDKQPTSIAELVPDHPVAVGPHDASGDGMGGVWLPSVTNSNLTPILWRAKFPEDITADLVSFSNPHGTINNSQLELAGSIGHNDVLQQEINCAGRTVVPLGDNTAATAWQHKGSASTSGPTAYLLRVSSLHQ